MIDIDTALRKILRAVRPLPEETADLSSAIGRVLSRPIKAATDLPSFDNATMDGYAVRSDGPSVLLVRETVPAGMPSARTLGPGEAAKIMTGAPIPKGADAVVMKELTKTDGKGRVALLHRPEPGEWIRPRGQDARKGDALLAAGTLLRPYEIALLAAQGITAAPVHRRPVVAVLSTGSELVPAYRPLAPGKIRDANGPAIRSALSSWKLPCIDLGIAADKPDILLSIFRRALKAADALIVSGGVSAGDFDLTKPLLESLGVKTIFWKVKVKPGKPLLFGMYKGTKPVFGLPGNPISVLACLDEFVKPALERLQGLVRSIPRDHLEGRALNAFELPRERRQLLFCAADLKGGVFRLRVIRPQASHMLARCSQANALALPAKNARRVKPGDRLSFRWLT